MSLNQGVILYAKIPNMSNERLPLMQAFDAIVRKHEILRAVFGLI